MKNIGGLKLIRAQGAQRFLDYQTPLRPFYIGRSFRLQVGVLMSDVLDAQFPVVVTAVPRVYLSCRGCLVGPYCRTVDYYQCYRSHIFWISVLSCAHAARCSEGCQYRTGDAYHQLRHKLNQFFLLHDFYGFNLYL